MLWKTATVPRTRSLLASVRREQPPAVPGAGVFGTAKVPKEAKKVGKITRSCDYRYWKGRVNWDYQESGRRYRHHKEVTEMKWIKDIRCNPTFPISTLQTCRNQQQNYQM